MGFSRQFWEKNRNDTLNLHRITTNINLLHFFHTLNIDMVHILPCQPPPPPTVINEQKDQQCSLAKIGNQDCSRPSPLQCSLSSIYCESVFSTTPLEALLLYMSISSPSRSVFLVSPSDGCFACSATADRYSALCVWRGRHHR